MTFEEGWPGSEDLVLSTGRREYVFTRDLSPGATGDVQYGNDGSFDTNAWTQAERDELADHVIQQWQTWKRTGARP